MSWRETTLVSVLYNVLVTIFIGGLCIPVGAIEAICTLKWPGRGDLLSSGIWIRRSWARLLLWYYRIRIDIEGPGASRLENLGGTVVIANHQSALDILVFAKCIPFPFAFLAKKELLMIPIFGWAAWMSGTVYVDRKKGVQDGLALSAVKRILHRGGSVALFPEGTRSKDGRLLAFKRGAFVMAIDSNSDVVPMAILGSKDLLQKNSIRVKSGVIRLWVGEPISTKGMSSEDRFALCDKARSIISNRLDLAA